MRSVSLFPYYAKDADDKITVPWNIKHVRASSFWPHSQGDGAVVAVVDTGLDVEHPEIKERIISPVNFTAPGYRDNDVRDKEGHGTHVAGIIGGKNTGIAPRCRIMPLKVFGDDKAGINIHEAFKYILEWNRTATEHDRVVAVNCSFGSQVYDPIMAYLIRTLTSSGVSVIVAAGNSGDGDPDTHEVFSYPAYIWEVITASAIKEDGLNAGYSNSFDGIDLGAPGNNICSCWPGGKYKKLSGTSMAAPHVAGAMALIYAMWRKREGRYPTVEEAEAVLWKHIRTADMDPFLIGRGILDLTYEPKRWPLYRVQIGAFYHKSRARVKQKEAEKLGLSTHLAKY